MTRKILIITSDYISSWIKKGEVVPFYYNPGNLFDEVHIMMTNNDKPDPQLVQPMAGDAKLYFYNYPEPENFFKKTFGWQPFLMKRWAQGAVKIAQHIMPDIIRCYGLHLGSFLGVNIKNSLLIPCVTSLHGNPDVDYLRGRLARDWKDKIIGLCQESLEKFCLRHLDHVIGVYSPIEPYLIKHHVKSYSIIHNTVGLGAPKKIDFSCTQDRINLLCVGRQTHLQKDPSNILRAVASLKEVHLTLVGDGDLHDGLVKLANQLECSQRIHFFKSMKNSELLSDMKNFDLYIYHSINYEISKSCIEAALVGLPIIVNNRNAQPAKELDEAKFYLVDDSKQAYADAIIKLASDKALRQSIAENSQGYAMKNWAPNITEEKVIKLYERLMLS